MYSFILGFHLRVWCPKWTPASNNCFIDTTAIITSCFYLHRSLPTSLLATGCDLCVYLACGIVAFSRSRFKLFSQRTQTYFSTMILKKILREETHSLPLSSEIVIVSFFLRLPDSHIQLFCYQRNSLIICHDFAILCQQTSLPSDMSALPVNGGAKRLKLSFRRLFQWHLSTLDRT